MYQDTYIEYWGEIFVSARIIEFGISFLKIHGST